MDPRQITRLAKLLRENGDKVLNSEYKITLTGSLLRALNDSFTLITDPNETCTPQTFQVLKPNNAKSDVFRELQIIYDFVQKTQILCLCHIPTEDPFDGQIDIIKFRALRRLEIQRIPIEQIVGIQRLRAHLQELICCKSIKSIESIIAHCGGDNANGFLWNELRVADFSYNCLKKIDSSLEFVSNLQHLNLSHNQIVSVDSIKWLPNLKKLNLSYNKLTEIPRNIVARRLQTLILTNNFIEDLNGLPKLEALSELNLSDNCILDHACLAPLGSLIALQQLQLHGNPISCHPNHREETVKYLHKNIASVKFVLDYQPLSKHEKNLVGYYQSFNHWHQSRRTQMRSANLHAPVKYEGSTPASSVGSTRSFRLDSSNSSLADLTEASQLNTSQLSSRRIKVKPALIADDDNNDDKTENEANNSTKTETIKDKSFGIGDLGKREHLETKKQIEQLREEHGDSWLFSKNASKVQSVMGIQASPAKPIDKSPQTTEQMLEKFFGMNTSANSDVERSSTPIQNDSMIVEPAQSPIEHYQSPLSSKTNFESIQNSDISSDNNTLKSVQTLAETTYESTNSGNDYNQYNNPFYGQQSDEPETVSDTEDNETVYIVTNDINKQDLLLVVSEQSVREKNAMNGRTINKWNMTMLESCERIKTDILRIRFDTVKRDKKERTYQIEKGQAQRLDERLRNILSKRPLSEMNQIIFRCANCATQFSRERLFRAKGETKCPECSSTYVIEIKEATSSPSTSQSILQHEKADVTLEKSASHSSIDESAAESDDVDTHVEHVTITEADSTANLIDGNGAMSNEMLLKPHKKQVLTGMNLTESSSSGSVTDGSICTTVENRTNDNKNSEQSTVTNTVLNPVVDAPVEHRSIDSLNGDLDTPVKAKEASAISNMFEGLFNHTSNLMKPRSKLTPMKTEPPCEKFKFNYKEFDNVDHRLKLFLYQNIFEDDGEHLKWLVKGRIFNDCASSDPNASLQPAIFVMSTTKWYVLHIIGKESDDVSKWIKRETFGSMDRIEMIRVLPWKVGITFTIKFFGNIHFLLQDIMRTDSLLLFFADNPLPLSCDLEYQISERISQKLLHVTGNVQLKMFTILNRCIITNNDDEKTILDGASLIITDTHLYVTTTNYGWLMDRLEQNIDITKSGLMVDVVDVIENDDTTFSIQFGDDSEDQKEEWECYFETNTCLKDTYASIAQSWEELFKVPLNN